MPVMNIITCLVALTMLVLGFFGGGFLMFYGAFSEDCRNRMKRLCEESKMSPKMTEVYLCFVSIVGLLCGILMIAIGASILLLPILQAIIAW